jgi:hypothetical protein
MLAAYLIALLIVAASVLLGQAFRVALGERLPSWLAAPTGFAALVVLAPFLVRLPGRAIAAALIVLILLVAAAIAIALRTDWRRWRIGGEPPRDAPATIVEGPPAGRPTRGPLHWWVGPAVVLIVIGAAALPFVLNDRFGVLGEGIYTNDHAAQLYWAEWLRTGFGPEPNAVRFGYPVGPQAVAAVAAQATGADLVAAFNGLLLAIPALTALAALAALGRVPPARRVLAASLVGLPFLAASFLAQSAFKETAMALFLVAFAISLSLVGGGAGEAGVRRAPLAVTAGSVVVLSLAAVLAYSAPGLVWFALAVAIWVGLELLAGRRPISLVPIREAIARHRALSAAGTLFVIAAVALAAGPAVAFFERIEDVQGSVGRLGSPVSPGEAFGVWPAGDYRLVRTDVSGAIPAALLGVLALAAGMWALVRRRETALLAALLAAGAVYAGTRLFGEIHVQAKALAVMAPLVMLISVRALLAPRGDGEPRRLAAGRLALGTLFATAAVLSTFLALRAAPVGFDQRAVALERFGDQIEGSSVVFLGVDRFAAYRLRGADVRSPGGFVPPRVSARSRKPWQQGQAMDFDTLSPAKLDRFGYAITTAAAYQSTAPPSMRPIAADRDYVLWERTGPTPNSRVLPGEGGDPGAVLECEGAPPRERFPAGTRAKVIGEPVVGEPEDWDGAEPVDPRDAAAGQEDAFLAPDDATQTLDLGAGRWLLSLQYHSQVPLTVEAPGTLVELPPSLDGMYLDGAGRGAFWPAGEVVVAGRDEAPTRITVRAAEPTDLQSALGVPRRVWLGALAATPLTDPRTMPVGEACSRYVDRLLVPTRSVSAADLANRSRRHPIGPARGAMTRRLIRGRSARWEARDPSSPAATRPSDR